MTAFFDTNVLVYAVDDKEPARQRIASGLLRESLVDGGPVISTQVMLEFRNAATSRNLLTGKGIELFLQDIAGDNIVPAHPEFIWRTFDTQERYGFSIWDAAIVQAAVDARCEVLYTEDLQDGQRIGALRIVNPFRGHAVHESRPKYGVAPGRKRKGSAT